MSDEDDKRALTRLEDVLAAQNAQSQNALNTSGGLAQQGYLDRYNSLNQGYQGYSTTACTCFCGYGVKNADVHHFTGAPKNEAKSVPCGQALVLKSGPGFRLTGLAASTEINEVTCLGCLRALISKGK